MALYCPIDVFHGGINGVTADKKSPSGTDKDDVLMMLTFYFEVKITYYSLTYTRLSLL